MSVGRLPPAAPQLPAVRPGAPAPARDAQRAFFAAALGQAAPVSPASAAVAATPQAVAPPGKAAAAEPEDGAPPRYLRPGSLLDIKV